MFDDFDSPSTPTFDAKPLADQLLSMFDGKDVVPSAYQFMENDQWPVALCLVHLGVGKAVPSAPGKMRFSGNLLVNDTFRGLVQQMSESAPELVNCGVDLNEKIYADSALDAFNSEIFLAALVPARKKNGSYGWAIVADKDEMTGLLEYANTDLMLKPYLDAIKSYLDGSDVGEPVAVEVPARVQGPKEPQIMEVDLIDNDSYYTSDGCHFFCQKIDFEQEVENYSKMGIKVIYTGVSITSHPEEEDYAPETGLDIPDDDVAPAPVEEPQQEEKPKKKRTRKPKAEAVATNATVESAHEGVEIPLSQIVSDNIGTTILEPQPEDALHRYKYTEHVQEPASDPGASESAFRLLTAESTLLGIEISPQTEYSNTVDLLSLLRKARLLAQEQECKLDWTITPM